MLEICANTGFAYLHLSENLTDVLEVIDRNLQQTKDRSRRVLFSLGKAIFRPAVSNSFKTDYLLSNT